MSSVANRGDGILDCTHNPNLTVSVMTGDLMRGRTRITTLDKAILCERDPTRRRIGAVKIDVESYEHLVVQGGKRVWETQSVPIVTYENDMMGMESRKAILTFFLDLGYW